MIEGAIEGSSPRNLNKGDLRVSSIPASQTVAFGPSFYGFIESDGTGWAPADVEIMISPPATPCRVALAINRVSPHAPVLLTDPICEVWWDDEDGAEWGILHLAIGAGIDRVRLTLHGGSVTEPRGQKRELAFRFSPFFGQHGANDPAPSVLDDLKASLPSAGFRSIFTDRPSPCVELAGLDYENAIVPDAYLVGFPSIIAIQHDGRLVPIVETNPYAVFLKPNLAACASNLPDGTLSCTRLENAISACGDWADNFWHWWCEFLPYVVSAWHAGWRGTIVVPSGKPLFHDSLALFDIPSQNILPQTTDVIQVDRLLLPRRQRGQYVAEDFALYKLVNAMVARRHPEGMPHRKLYIARRSSRVVRNEDEVFGWLEPQGYEKVFMEDHSLADQVALAHQAIAIVGPHGAGMTAALFMPPGGTLVEFFGPVYVNPCMLEVCRDLGHRYAMVVSRIYRDRPYQAGDDLDVDMPSLRAAMRSFQ